MFTSLFDANSALTFLNVFYIVICSLGCGFFISFEYKITRRAKAMSQGFSHTLLLMPFIVAMIIILVASDFARAFSLAGVFTLIRFRSEPGESKDITYILLVAAIGLACGLGYISLAIFLAIIAGVILFVLDKSKYGAGFAKKQLKIVIPENLNYEQAFDSVFDEYCTKYALEKVRTRDFGSLFELSYVIEVKKNLKEKDFMDAIRVINSNLEISLVTIS